MKALKRKYYRIELLLRAIQTIIEDTHGDRHIAAYRAETLQCVIAVDYRMTGVNPSFGMEMSEVGLFGRISNPVFYKDDSQAKQQLQTLQELKQMTSGTAADAIEREIRLVEAGIAGEQQVRFELENSHIPMYVLHDLYYEYDGLTAQIDYLLITRKHQFVVECKNLYGNIEITSDGGFIRTLSYGRHVVKEGIYSPITQNRRHLELIKQIRGAEKNALLRYIFEKDFYNNYRSVVVLANPKTVLNARFAKRELRNQVIRADQLAEYIRRADSGSDSMPTRYKDMESLAQFFVSTSRRPAIDYTEKFRTLINDAAPPPAQEEPSAAAQPEQPVESAADVIICPRCGAPMVRRKATKGQNAGREFYGCSNYPRCRGIVNIR